MNEGDYVRIEDGNYSCIGKIKRIEKTNCTHIIIDYSDNDDFDEGDYFDWNVKKSSPNIIDLIEKGDVITLTSKYCEGDIYQVDGAFHNGISVNCIGDGSMFIKNDSDIKTVITKEQIKQIEYKVGDK